jgi:uncharacterized membrane protein
MLVTEDGDAVVNQTLAVPQNATSVTVPLLSSQVDDVYSADQEGTAVSYAISGQNITIYTLGVTLVYLSYQSESLTSKSGTLWTLDYSWDANSTLELPYGSTILSISSLPLSISALNGSPVLVLGPGAWEVSYGLAIVTTQTTSSAQTSSSIGKSPTASTVSTGSLASAESGNPQLWSFVLPILIVVAAAAAAGAYLVLRRRRRRGLYGPDTLRPDDLEILRFIRDRGGKVVEAEIRERFGVPRTSAWRQTKRLEQLGYIRVRKVGSQNQLELVRTDFERSSG